MKSARTTFLPILLAVAMAVGAAAQTPGLVHPVHHAVAVAVGASAGPVGFDYFYRNLGPHGYWVQRSNYGWVWAPRGVAAGWRPYSAGRWVYTDDGWTWASTESWGWATYHYGRWYDDPDYGWMWTPGTDWGPAWVSWQEGGNYVGWAPLPPAVGWSAGVGLDLGGFNLSVGIAPSAYCFVPEGSFLAANVGAYIVPVGNNGTIFRNTSNITNYAVANGHAFNRGLAVDRVRQITGRPVPTYRLAAMNSGGPRGDRLSGNSLAVFRPQEVVRRANTPDPAHVVPHAVATSAFLAQRAAAHRSVAAAAGRGEGQAAPGRGVAPRTAVPARRPAPAARNTAALAHRAPTGATRTNRTPVNRSVNRRSTAAPNRGAAVQHHAAPVQHRTAVQHRAAAPAQRHAAPAQHSAAQHRAAPQQHAASQHAAAQHHASPPPQQHPAERRPSPPPQRRAEPPQHAAERTPARREHASAQRAPVQHEHATPQRSVQHRSAPAETERRSAPSPQYHAAQYHAPAQHRAAASPQAHSAPSHAAPAERQSAPMAQERHASPPPAQHGQPQQHQAPAHPPAEHPQNGGEHRPPSAS
jgi:hypothetical protein